MYLFNDFVSMPKLFYFAFPGRAEVARLSFHIGNIDFEVRIRHLFLVPTAFMQNL